MRAVTPTTLLTLGLALFTLVAAPAGTQAQSFADTVPVTDRAAFIERVKNNLLNDQDAESLYTYSERRREFQTTRGQRTVKSERVFEVYPELDGRGIYRRLVATDGKATPPTELAKVDRKRQEQVQRTLQERVRETARQRDQRLNKEKKDRAEERARLEESFRLLEFRFVERTTLGGRPALVAEFRPRAGARATSREGRVLQKFKGRAFVSESDAQVVRVEMEALGDISFGLGLLAKVNRGSQAAFERRFVNGEVWLPASFRLRASGRKFLFAGIDLDTEVEWSDYRKFTVDTKETVAAPR